MTSKTKTPINSARVLKYTLTAFFLVISLLLIRSRHLFIDIYRAGVKKISNIIILITPPVTDGGKYGHLVEKEISTHGISSTREKRYKQSYAILTVRNMSQLGFPLKSGFLNILKYLKNQKICLWHN